MRLGLSALDEALRWAGAHSFEWRAAAALISVCILLPATAMAALSGRPPLSRFTPDVEVFPQNFDIAQDGAAIVYVANADGVLSFDGKRWQHLALPNSDMARTLAYDGASRVYVGGYDLFGYIERDESGLESFRDLTPLAAEALKGEAFADVWDILVTGEGVFFRAVSHVFLYSPASDSLRMWRYEGRYGAIVEHEGQVLLQFRGEGLKRLRGADWEIVKGGEALKDQVYQFLPLPDGALLALSRDGSWRQFVRGQLKPYAMPRDFPPSSFFATARVLADGSYAMAADDGAIYFYDPLTRGVRRFQVGSDPLAGLVPAADGGLLTMDDLGMSHLTWPSAWTMVGAESGLTGSVHGIRRWRDGWLVLSSAGVYEMVDGADGASRFERRDWTRHEAWDALPLDDNNVLLAESYVLKLVERGTARTLTRESFYPRMLRRSTFDPSVVYVGTEQGLGILRREGRDWQLLLDPVDRDYVRINSIVELSPQQLWIGTEREGVQLLTLSEDRRTLVESRGFAAEDGITYGRVSGSVVTRMPDGSVVASTGSGFFTWEDGRFRRTELDGLETLRGPEEWLTLRVAPNGDTWAFSYNHAYRRAGDGGWQRQEIGSFLRGGLEALAFEPSGAALFGASSSILHFEPAFAANAGAAPRLALRSVEVLDEMDRRQYLPQRPVELPQIPQDASSIVFRFALPEYRRPDAARYRGRLIGIQDELGDWSESTVYTYSRLDPGEYRFEVFARDALGQVTGIEPYRFVVAPFWYNTLWARVVAVLLGLAVLGAAVYAGVRVRTRMLAAETLRLEALVADRTRELKSANRQLEAMAHLDGLTEVPNRRRLDDYLSEVWRQCADHARPMSVIAIDVDHFKSYNDKKGHLAGDDVLKKLVRVVSHCLRRAEDLVARFGGDEFLVVLPGADLKIAHELAERIRREVEANAIGSTVSIGVATRLPRAGEEVPVLVAEADAALYQAKHSGRNRVVAMQPVAA